MLRALLVPLAAASTVQLNFYGEAGWPFCRAFTGKLADALAPEKGLAPHVELSIMPWGNAYYAGAVAECGGSGSDYDPDVRMCWDKHCGADAPASCFGGTLVHQHGPVEGQANALFSCIITHKGVQPGTAGLAHEALEQIACVESHYEELNNQPYSNGTRTLQDVYQNSCSGTADVYACSTGAVGAGLQISAAKATPQHAGVPYVLLNGQSVDNPLDIQSALCAALKDVSPAPAACASAVLVV